MPKGATYRSLPGRSDSSDTTTSSTSSSSSIEYPFFRIYGGGRALRYPSAKTMEPNVERDLLSKFSSSIKIVGRFSEDHAKVPTNDDSMKKAIDMSLFPTKEENREKKIELDLTESEEAAEFYFGTPRNAMNNLLWFIKDNPLKVRTAFPQPEGDTKTRRLYVDFVGTKKVFTDIMKLPFQEKTYTGFYAQKVSGTIYLMGAKQLPKTYRDVKQELMRQKFRQIMSGEAGSLGSVPNREYKKVLRAEVGDFKILYSVNIDLEDPNYADKARTARVLPNFLLLRTVMYEEKEAHFAMERIKEEKMLHWYFNGLFASVARLLLCFRSREGSSNLLKVYTTEELFAIAKEHCKPAVGLHFLNKVLQFVKRRLEKEYSHTLILFEKPHRKHFLVSEEASYTVNLIISDEQPDEDDFF